MRPRFTDASVPPHSNLSLALSLPNLVADERFQLYLEFVPASPDEVDAAPLGLKAYLDEVKEAALASLEVGKGPVGVGADAK